MSNPRNNDPGPNPRTPPQGMPRDVPSEGRAPRQISRERDRLPEQKPITDELPPPGPPSKVRVFFKRLGVILLAIISLAFAYLFLLLGEPDRDAEPKIIVQEEVIRVPMAAVEADGTADLGAIAANFGKPVLTLYGTTLSLQRVTLYDTAFQGGYARRAILLYAFEDGQTLKVESVRPTAAAALLSDSSSSLSMAISYSLGGFEAARMDNEDQSCVFAKSPEAVYAITCPASHEAELNTLVRQGMVVQPSASNP